MTLPDSDEFDAAHLDLQWQCHAKPRHTPGVPAPSSVPAPFYLRVKVTKDAVCNFSYSADGTKRSPVGEPFTARNGKWIGAKVGLFAVRTGKTRETGFADFDWFRVERIGNF